MPRPMESKAKRLLQLASAPDGVLASDCARAMGSRYSVIAPKLQYLRRQGYLRTTEETSANNQRVVRYFAIEADVTEESSDNSTGWLDHRPLAEALGNLAEPQPHHLCHPYARMVHGRAGLAAHGEASAGSEA